MDEILESTILEALLEGSNRWGVNWQPDAYWFAAELAKLPVSRVRAQDDTLELWFARPLTGSEGFNLAQAALADTPEEVYGDLTYVQLWWD